jgi:hypothetical protein
MSVSGVSGSAYQVQWPSLSSADSTDKSGAPSDALLSLFGAFTGGGQSCEMGPPPLPSDGASGSPQFSSGMMSTMISMLGDGSGTSPLDQLIGKFDSDSDGKISQSEFEQAAGADADMTKADALFAKIDKDGDGTVTKDELGQAIQKAHSHHHAEQAGGGEGVDAASGTSSAEQSKGTTRQAVTNADGSITTTITYGDGSKISMTTPPAGASAASSTSGATALNAMNLKGIIEKMIAAQAQMFTQQQSAVNVSA